MRTVPCRSTRILLMRTSQGRASFNRSPIIRAPIGGEEAKAAYAKALEIDPTFKEAREGFEACAAKARPPPPPLLLWRREL